MIVVRFLHLSTLSLGAEPGCGAGQRYWDAASSYSGCVGQIEPDLLAELHDSEWVKRVTTSYRFDCEATAAGHRRTALHCRSGCCSCRTVELSLTVTTKHHHLALLLAADFHSLLTLLIDITDSLPSDTRITNKSLIFIAPQRAQRDIVTANPSVCHILVM